METHGEESKDGLTGRTLFFASSSFRRKDVLEASKEVAQELLVVYDDRFLKESSLLFLDKAKIEKKPLSFFGNLKDFLLKEDEEALNLSQRVVCFLLDDSRWHNILEHRGVKIANPLQSVLLLNYFFPIRTCLKLIDEVFRKERPRKALFYEEGNELSKALEFVCVSRGIKFEKLHPAWEKMIVPRKYWFLPTETKVILMALVGFFGWLKNLFVKVKRGKFRLVFFSLKNVDMDIMSETFKILFKKNWSIFIIQSMRKLKRRPDINAFYRWRFSFFYPSSYLSVRKALREVEKLQLPRFNQPFLDFLAKDLHRFLLQEGLKVIYEMVETIINVIKHIEPNVIVSVDEAFPFARCIAKVGEAHKIPIIFVQHGIIVGLPRHFEVVGSKIAVYGESSKEALERRGAQSDSIEITGSTKLDQVVKRKLKEKSEVLKELGLVVSPELKVIVFLAALRLEGKAAQGQAVEKKSQEALEKLIRALIDIGNCVLIFKSHPLGEGRDEYYLEVVKSYRNQLRMAVVREYNLYDLLHACDLAVTEYSTAGMEAAFLDRKILTLNFMGFDYTPYVKEGVALGAFKEEDVLPQLKKLLYDENVSHKLKQSRDKFIYRHLYLKDGKASERIVELIEREAKASLDNTGEKF